MVSAKNTPQEDSWQLLTGNNLIIRKRESVSKDIKKTYPFRIGISFLFKSDASFFELANVFEDELVSIIEETNKGLLVAVLTGKNNEGKDFREYVLYIDNNKASPEVFQKLFEKHKSLSASIYGKKDASWKIYKSLK